MELTGAEQYLIEMINRARLDPQAEAARFGLRLNAGLSGIVISGDVLQVVVPNTFLEKAALRHSTWMIVTDIFDHTGAGGDSPGARIIHADYEFLDIWAWREDLVWTGSTGAVNLVDVIEEHHEGLYRSAGHRVNTFSKNNHEICVAQVAGEYTHQGTAYNSSMLAIKFAQSGPDVYVTGVAYSHTDCNGFYGVGEGMAGIWIRADGEMGRTGGAGGYGFGVTASSSTTVGMAGGRAE